jgi:hypothetical protein
MTEFTEGRMLIYVYNVDLLITKDYCVIHRVTDPDAGNTQKYQHIPFFNFHIDNFSFVLVAGWKSMNVLNLSTGEMQPLIETEVKACRSSHSVMFTKRDDSGVTIHFCRTFIDDDGIMMQEWLYLPIMADFIDCLRELGRLPVTTT